MCFYEVNLCLYGKNSVYEVKIRLNEASIYLKGEIYMYEVE